MYTLRHGLFYKIHYKIVYQEHNYGYKYQS